MPCTRRWSLPYSCWPHYFCCRPDCCWPSWPTEHTVGSCSASCWSWPPGPLLPGNFPATFPPSLYSCMGLLWPKCRTWHLLLFSIIWLGSAHLLSLFRCLCRAFLPSGRSTVPPNLVSSRDLRRVHFLLLQMVLCHLNCTAPSTFSLKFCCRCSVSVFVMHLLRCFVTWIGKWVANVYIFLLELSLFYYFIFWLLQPILPVYKTLSTVKPFMTALMLLITTPTVK